MDTLSGEVTVTIFCLPFILMLSTLGKIFSRWHFEIFFLFSQKTGFDISCKLSQMETICMNGQILFSGKNKKNIINLLSAELAQRLTMVNLTLKMPRKPASEKVVCLYGLLNILANFSNLFLHTGKQCGPYSLHSY